MSEWETDEASDLLTKKRNTIGLRTKNDQQQGAPNKKRGRPVISWSQTTKTIDLIIERLPKPLIS